MNISIFCYAQENKIVLKFAETTAQIGLRGDMTNYLLEEVEKSLGDKLQIDVYWGASLLSHAEILRGVRNGSVDIGDVAPDVYPTQLILHSGLALFTKAPIKHENLLNILNRCYEEIPEFENEILSQNQKVLYAYFQLSMGVCSTKPFTSYDDFKDKKIRASGRWYLGMLEGAGAFSVNIPFGDCYMALQTGTIDGVFTTIDGIHRTKMDEVAKNVMIFKEFWFSTPHLYTINLDTWNSLPENIQNGLVDACKRAINRYNIRHSENLDEIISAQKEMGVIVTIATEEDINKFANMAKIDELKDQWIKEVKETGIQNANEILNKIGTIINDEINKEKESIK